MGMKIRFLSKISQHTIGLLVAVISNLALSWTTSATLLPMRVYDGRGNFRECGKFGKVLLKVTDMKSNNQTDAKVYQWVGCKAMSDAWPARPQDREFPPVRINPRNGYPLFIGSRQCGYINFTFRLVPDPKTGLEKREKIVRIKNCKLFSNLIGGETSSAAASNFPEEFEGAQVLIDEPTAEDPSGKHR